MIFHENRLPADDSHEISCLICVFLKKQQNLKLSSAANYRWCFMCYHFGFFPANIYVLKISVYLDALRTIFIIEINTINPDQTASFS